MARAALFTAALGLAIGATLTQSHPSATGLRSPESFLDDPMPLVVRPTPELPPQPTTSPQTVPSEPSAGLASWTGVEPAGCWGPGFTAHPDTEFWTAHLSEPAFAALAPLSRGVIAVEFRVLGIGDRPA